MRTIRRLLESIVVFGTLVAPALAQSSATRGVQSYVSSHQHAIVSELMDLVSIPNTRSDAGLTRNAALVKSMFARRGFSAEAVDTPGAPLVLATLDVPAAKGTILLYAHYDGQPVDPARWKQPTPFTPVLRRGRMEDGAATVPNATSIASFDPNWRLYARSASDDKAPIVALLSAVDALKADGRVPTWNLRVLIDGEEETNSAGMNAVLPRYKERLKSDFMLFFDGPLHPSGRPTIAFGVRGLLGIQLTVYGPKVELHSGHYGNWVPNPATRLVQLLASMKADDGRVLISGFYDGIAALTADEQAALRAVPDDADGLKKTFGVARSEPYAPSLQEALQRPSFNIRGLSSGFVGPNTTNVIPAVAQASIDIRLVQDTPSASMAEKVRAHIRTAGFHIVDADPDDATRARYPDIIKFTTSGITEGYRTSLTTPTSARVVAALTQAFGMGPVMLRTMGGTLPVADLVRTLQVPAIVIPTVNFDNNQHSDNENVRLGDFFTSITTMAALLTM